MCVCVYIYVCVCVCVCVCVFSSDERDDTSGKLQMFAVRDEINSYTRGQNV